jgi:putative ABC transport system permease protein
MNTQIVLSGLRARPVRTAVGIIAVTLEVVLILMLVGITNGNVNETGKRVAGVGGEIVIKDADASYIIAISEAILPVPEITDMVKPVPGVKAVTPIITATEGGGFGTVVSGIDPESFNAVSGGFTYLDGHMFSAPHEALVDDWQARKKNIHVGDEVKILNKPYKISGIVKAGKMSRIFMPIETLQEIKVKKDFATIMYVKVADGAKVTEVKDRIQAVFVQKNEKYEAVEAEEWVGMMFEQNATLINGVFQFVTFLGVSIGVLVIFLSMYTSVSERTREIGILRSMGGSKSFIVGLVMQESFILCVIGTIIGIGLSFALAPTIQHFNPTMVVTIPPRWVLFATISALASGVIGSLYPAYRAASQDPIEALAYE